MHCQDCDHECRKHGFNRNSTRRYRCGECGKTYSEEREHLFGDMRVNEETALMALKMLCEGSSVRATSRITGMHKSTVLKLLCLAGERCERLFAQHVKDVPVKDVQLDEIWSFVGKKQGTKNRQGDTDPMKGDAYCFTALERTSKLILAWHLGRRTNPHTDAFLEKVERATTGGFQVTSDGLSAYPEAVSYHFGARGVDFATLVKEYGSSEDGEEQRRYGPPRLTGTIKTPIMGQPDDKRICTSHVERHNLSIRTHLRRLTRLTIAFSKCWENHRAALALFFAHYNFCRMHSTISMTPAMKADLTRRPWSMRDLMEAATHC